MTEVLSFIFKIPIVDRGVFCTWQRNFLYFKQTLMISLFWVFLEPMVYFIGIGYGLGGMIESVSGQSYISFFAPAFVAASSMMVSYYESTYSSYTKLTRQRTYKTMLLTPLNPSEIVLGEILWASSKGLLSAVAISMVAIFLGLFNIFEAIPIILFAFINCWIISSFGLLMCGYAKNYDWFIYSLSGFMMPMYMFSGVFFPLDRMPELLQKAAFVLPLTNVVALTRGTIHNNFDLALGFSFLYLVVLGFVLTNWATGQLQKKLIS